MAELEIYWSQTALKQRNETFEYWNNRNKSKRYSKRLSLLIKERTQQLITYPNSGRKIDIENVRAISIEHFSLFYEKVEDKIIIISFWDNRRNPKYLLNILKNK